MGKQRTRHSNFNLTKTIKSFVKNPYLILVTMLAPLFVVTYNCGGSNMASKKDKEITLMGIEFLGKLEDMERQHREEVKDIENERDAWKDKYFKLASEETGISNNSP